LSWITVCWFFGQLTFTFLVLYRDVWHSIQTVYNVLTEFCIAFIIACVLWRCVSKILLLPQPLSCERICTHFSYVLILFVTLIQHKVVGNSPTYISAPLKSLLNCTSWSSCSTLWIVQNYLLSLSDQIWSHVWNRISSWSWQHRVKKWKSKL